MSFFVYILFSSISNKYYVGSSADVEKRLQRHNAGATKSTKSGRPWKIMHIEEFSNKSDALKRENYIKRMKSRVYIESLINS